MCRPGEYPPYDDQPDPGEGQMRLYDVAYAVIEPTFQPRHMRVLAVNTDEARAKAKSLDPDYLTTIQTPRIVR